MSRRVFLVARKGLWTHLGYKRCRDVVDDIWFNPIGFRPLEQGQSAAAAALVTIGQGAIVPVLGEANGSVCLSVLGTE